MKLTRRRILKGTSAVPLLFTMRTASGQALGSAAACMKRDALKAASPPKPSALMPVDNDDWLRVKLDLCELSVYSGNKLRTLEGKYFLGADNLTYWKVAGMTASPTEYTVHTCSARKTGEFRYALVYVDPLGNQVGYAMQQNGGQAITGSCWTSLKPKGW